MVILVFYLYLMGCVFYFVGPFSDTIFGCDGPVFLASNQSPFLCGFCRGRTSFVHSIYWPLPAFWHHQITRFVDFRFELDQAIIVVCLSGVLTAEVLVQYISDFSL